MADANKSVKRLVMTFATELDKKNVSLSIDNPTDSLAESSIKAAMQTIIEKDIFDIAGDKLASMVEAKIVVTNTNEYDLV